MRVILVNKFHYRKGGAETYYLTIGERLKAMGHNVAYFSMQHPNNLPCRQEKYFVTQREYNNVKNPLKAIGDGLALAYSKESLEKFEALCESFRPNIVHLNNVHRQITLSILDAPYLEGHHVPVIYTAHDYVTVCPNYQMLDGNGKICDDCVKTGKYGHCIQKRCVKGSKAKSALAAYEASFNRCHHMNDKIDCAIAPSQFMANMLVEGGWPKRKVVFMRNFMNEDILRKAAVTDSATDFHRPYLLFFGRISHEKGVDVLIDAFKRAMPEIPADFRLVIAGDGPEKSAYEAKANDNPRIEFVGFKSGVELQYLIEGSTLAVTPSIWPENMPYSIIEAFAAGTPVIGSKIGGIPELIVEGKTGYGCLPGDVESLADTIIRGLSNGNQESVYKAMQKNCRDYVLVNCNQDRYMTRLIDLYEEEIDGKRA